VRFTDLRKWVTELDDFDDNSAASKEGQLEEIQKARYEDWKDAQE